MNRKRDIVIRTIAQTEALQIQKTWCNCSVTLSSTSVYSRSTWKLNKITQLKIKRDFL